MVVTAALSLLQHLSALLSLLCFCVLLRATACLCSHNEKNADWLCESRDRLESLQSGAPPPAELNEPAVVGLFCKAFPLFSSSFLMKQIINVSSVFCWLLHLAVIH